MINAGRESMASSLLSQNPLPTIEWKTRLYPRPSPTRPFFDCYRVRTKSFKTLSIVRCSFPGNNVSVRHTLHTETKRNPFEILAESIMSALKKIAAAALLVGFLLMHNPNSAFAAGSGGRMGGICFSSRSSSSSSSSASRSYSAPKTSSSSSSPSMIFIAPKIMVSPLFIMFKALEVVSSSSIAVYNALEELEENSSSSSSSSKDYSARERRSSSPSSAPETGSSSSSESVSAPETTLGSVPTVLLLFCPFVALVALFIVSMILLDGFRKGTVRLPIEKASVIKLQVGSLGSRSSLQKDINRIAETADTSTPKGLHYILTEIVLALLRHHDYFISAYSSVDIEKSMEGVEKTFNQLSKRSKFYEETLVNFDNIKKQSSTRQRGSGLSHECIVVTILVAADGEHELPSINNSTDLKEALQKLASIPLHRTLGVEVIWTPQNEYVTLSDQELLEGYSLLRPL